MFNLEKLYSDAVTLGGKALDVAEAKALGEQDKPLYGGDESGRAYLRGQSTGYLAGVPPLVLIGAAVLGAALLVYLVKR